MITVEVFFSDTSLFKSVEVALWKSGIRMTIEREIDDGAYVYTITEYNCDEGVIVNAFGEFFNTNIL